MQTTPFAQPRPTLLKRAALRALTGERLVTGLLLVAWGLFGLFTVVSHGALPTRAAEAPAMIANVGFLFPFLKGLEILLKLYTAPEEVRSPVEPEGPFVPVAFATCRRERRAHRSRTTRAGLERSASAPSPGARGSGSRRRVSEVLALAS